MDIPLLQFLSSNPAILATVIAASVLIGIGLVFEIGWHVHKRMKINSHHSNDHIHEKGSNVGFSDSDRSIDLKNKLELDAVKSDLKSLKASVAQISELLNSIHANTKK